MAELEKYQKNIIRGIKRKFSKDEAISLLTKQLSEKDIEIGKLKSYLQELEEMFNGENTPIHIKKWKNKYETQLKMTLDLQIINKNLKFKHKKEISNLKARISILTNK